jgi:hypothetical protein
MEAVEVLDALAYHEKQIAYHQAQSLRVLADYAIACEGDEFFEQAAPHVGRPGEGRH